MRISRQLPQTADCGTHDKDTDKTYLFHYCNLSLGMGENAYGNFYLACQNNEPGTEISSP